MKYLVQCILVFSILFCSLDADQVKEEAKILGSYSGEVFNGADLDPVITSFSYNEDGDLVGNYIVEEEDGELKGTLTNADWESLFTLTFKWTDKYGTGKLRVLFSGGYKIFSGFWGAKGEVADVPWNGVKNKEKEIQ